MTKKYICVEDAIENIRHMMDYDGFREGDCVSRRAVIGILDSMKAEVIPEIDWAFTSVTRNIGHRKLIDAYEFADMWRSYAITDEQRELSDRIARSAEEFHEAKTGNNRPGTQVPGYFITGRPTLHRAFYQSIS